MKKVLEVLKGVGGAVIPGLGDILGKAIPDKAKLAEVQAQIEAKAIEAWTALVEQAGGIIMAEAQGESWMQRNWRPLTMMVFVFIIFNNYVIAPYVEAFGGMVPTLELTDNMWGLLKIGLGGYIVGRSTEKGLKIWKDKD